MKRTALRPRVSRPLWAAARPLRAPPSSALINAVIEHADLVDDMGGGRKLLRLTPAAIADANFDHLGEERARLGHIAILWDQVEDQVVRVLDGGP